MTALRIETTWVDTTGLEPGEQFDHWAAHGAAARYMRADGDLFTARGAFWNLGSAVVTRAEVDPFISVRDATQIVDRPLDHLQFVALLSGKVAFDDGTTKHELAAPCLFACDYSRTFRLETEQTQIASAYMSRPFLEEAIRPLAAHGPLEPSAESAFLASTLSGLCTILPFAAAASAPFYARMLRDLIAATVFDPSRAPLSTGDAHVRRRIEAAIARVPAGELDIAALCRAEGIARSKLYRLFAGHGGPVTWDRTRRLRAFYRDVTDPNDRRSLAEIGMVHGFFDSASLARAFRLQFGLPASAVRSRARSGSGWYADADDGFTKLRRSVEALSIGC